MGHKPKIERYLIHINEGFVTEVSAASLDGAILAALAQFKAKNPDRSNLGGEITWTNIDEYERQTGNKYQRQADDKGQVQS